MITTITAFDDTFNIDLKPETVEEAMVLLRLTRQSKVEPPQITFDTSDAGTLLEFRKAKSSKFNASWVEGGRKS